MWSPLFELCLGIVILILVIYGLKVRILKVSIMWLMGVVGLSIWSYGQGVDWLSGLKGGYEVSGLLLTNGWSDMFKGVLVIVCVLLLLMYSGEFRSSSTEEGLGNNWGLLVLIVLLSSLLLVSSVNWLAIYLALELQTLTLLILVAKGSAYSAEAGLKYFVLGGVSSGLFLFGCALLYGMVGETGVQGVNSVLVGHVGKVLITVSLLFKLSGAPFHMWAPDVYEGAPTITTALLAVMPKIAVFSVLVQVGLVSSVLLCSGVLSIIVGAIGALNQVKMKRLLAYSGVGHMGFLCFGVALGSFESVEASLVYVLIYALMSICGFSVLLSLGWTRALIIEVAGLSRENAVLGVTLGLTFFSTAGIPPLSGFLGKWLVLLSGVSSSYYLICVIIVIFSVIAGVYYVRVVQWIYFPNYGDLIWQKILKKLKGVNLRKSVILGVVLFMVLFLMISPNWVLEVVHDAGASLYMSMSFISL